MSQTKRRWPSPGRSRRIPWGLLILAAGLAGAGLFPPPAVRAQSDWLNYEDGEILNVASADGPAAGQPFIQARRSVEQSTLRGTVVLSRLRFQYGVNNFISVGASALHLQQSYHGFQKRGLGDTNLFVKLYYRPNPEMPFRIGLRQSLSIPTGYERERDGLAAFTSRNSDYAAQGLLQYVNPRFSAYLNPGVILPGGHGDTELTGGLGLAFTLPFRIDLRGEYYTRWDVVTHRSISEIYGGARTPSFMGLSLQAGVKRRLLQNEQVQPEYQLAVCLGRDRTPDADAYQIPVHRGTAALLVHPIESMVPDPHGIAADLAQTFRSDESGGGQRLAVYVRAYPAENAQELLKERHYELNVKLLEISEGKTGGLDLGPVMRWNRSKTEITAQAELIAPDGYSVLRRSVYRGLSSKTTGIELAPDSGSLDAKVTPDEVRDRLRASAVRDLAAQVIRDVVRVMNERDEP